MYETPALLTSYTLAWAGFFALGAGVLLMLEAGRASMRGAPLSRVQREGSMGAWACVGGVVLLVVAGIGRVLS